MSNKNVELDDVAMAFAAMSDNAISLMIAGWSPQPGVDFQLTIESLFWSAEVVAQSVVDPATSVARA